MRFSSRVEGPLDVGAMMVAFCEVYDAAGVLFNPSGAVVRVTAESSDWEGVYLTPGDKGPGKCEFAPLMGQDTVYLFQIQDGSQASYPPLSAEARCDLGLPFADGTKDQGGGQFHKSFYVRFGEGDAPPEPPPDPDPDPRTAELEAALRDQRRRWSVLRQAVLRQYHEALAAIDAVLP